MREQRWVVFGLALDLLNLIVPLEAAPCSSNYDLACQDCVRFPRRTDSL